MRTRVECFVAPPGRAASTRRLTRRFANSTKSTIVVTGSVGVTGVFACNDPSLQAPPLRSFTIRSRSCTVASFFCAVFRYRVEPSRPGQASGPFLLCNLLAWRRSWGSLRCPSQACSRIGCEIIADHAGPRACSTRPSAPIDFRRVIPSSFDASMQTREPRNLRKVELGFWA